MDIDKALKENLSSSYEVPKYLEDRVKTKRLNKNRINKNIIFLEVIKSIIIILSVIYINIPILFKLIIVGLSWVLINTSIFIYFICAKREREVLI
ncbi:MAG: hypothetical protein ACTHWZ_07490 [Peptoniphilaceae bacterium]